MKNVVSFNMQNTSKTCQRRKTLLIKSKYNLKPHILNIHTPVQTSLSTSYIKILIAQVVECFPTLWNVVESTPKQL